jgi:carnitine-CoA ligase
MDPDARIPQRDECVAGDLLRHWASARPDRHFLEFADGSAWTFSDTLSRVQQAAAGLRSLGVRHGSHVLCWMPNAAEAVLAWLAANYLGAVHVPINTGYRGRLLQHAIELSDARVMVAHASLLPRLREIETALLRDVVVVGEVPAAIGGLTLHGVDVLQPSERAEPS